MSIDIGPVAKAELSSLPVTTNPENITAFRNICREFLVELATQVYDRFPFKEPNIRLLKHLSFIDPANNVKDISEVAHFFGYDVEQVHAEYKELRRVFKQDLSPDYRLFWKKVAASVGEGGEAQYPLTIEIVRRVLVLPHSSADCERIFSQITLNKTKVRNKLSTNSLSAILHGKNLLKKHKNSVLTIDYTPIMHSLSNVDD